MFVGVPGLATINVVVNGQDKLRYFAATTPPADQARPVQYGVWFGDVCAPPGIAFVGESYESTAPPAPRVTGGDGYRLHVKF